MIFLALLASILAAGVALTMLFLTHGRPDDDRGGQRADMVRYFGVAAIAALLCGKCPAGQRAIGWRAAQQRQHISKRSSTRGTSGELQPREQFLLARRARPRAGTSRATRPTPPASMKLASMGAWAASTQATPAARRRRSHSAAVDTMARKAVSWLMAYSLPTQ